MLLNVSELIKFVFFVRDFVGLHHDVLGNRMVVFNAVQLIILVIILLFFLFVDETQRILNFFLFVVFLVVVLVVVFLLFEEVKLVRYVVRSSMLAGFYRNEV